MQIFEVVVKVGEEKPYREVYENGGAARKGLQVIVNRYQGIGFKVLWQSEDSATLSKDVGAGRKMLMSLSIESREVRD